jgi:hypothetical protein
MGTALVKNPKILVEETVRSTAVGTFRISQYPSISVILTQVVLGVLKVYVNAARARRRVIYVHKSGMHLC